VTTQADVGAALGIAEQHPGALSPRQIEIIKLVAEGLGNAEIGQRLFVEVDTIKTHLRRAFKILGARARAHAVVIAMRTGQIPLWPDDTPQDVIAAAQVTPTQEPPQPVPPAYRVDQLAPHVGKHVVLHTRTGVVIACRVTAVDRQAIHITADRLGQALTYRRCDVARIEPLLDADGQVVAIVRGEGPLSPEGEAAMRELVAAVQRDMDRWTPEQVTRHEADRQRNRERLDRIRATRLATDTTTNREEP
jgi:DNA-binding CsgD family transcriptional regulator